MIKRVPVEYAKLGRNKRWGEYWGEGKAVVIDSRLKGKKHLEILIHECLHYIYPEKIEEEIVASSILLTNTLWEEGYRRIDNDISIPLQDGTQ